MVTNWKTIHIFGGGDHFVQVIGNEDNVRYPISSFTKLEPLANHMWTHKPDNFVGDDQYRIITLMKDAYIEWSSKNAITSPVTGNEKLSYRIKPFWFNQTILRDFIQEIGNIN